MPEGPILSVLCGLSKRKQHRCSGIIITKWLICTCTTQILIYLGLNAFVQSEPVPGAFSHVTCGFAVSVNRKCGLLCGLVFE